MTFCFFFEENMLPVDAVYDKYSAINRRYVALKRSYDGFVAAALFVDPHGRYFNESLSVEKDQDGNLLIKACLRNFKIDYVPFVEADGAVKGRLRVSEIPFGQDLYSEVDSLEFGPDGYCDTGFEGESGRIYICADSTAGAILLNFVISALERAET